MVHLIPQEEPVTGADPRFPVTSGDRASTYDFDKIFKEKLHEIENFFGP